MTQPEIEIRTAWRHLAGHEHDTTATSTRSLLRYAEPHRYYHTATHIMMVRSTPARRVGGARADSLRPSSSPPALYHDAIYDPRADDNEARSATLAIDDLDRHRMAAERCDVGRRP